MREEALEGTTSQIAPMSSPRALRQRLRPCARAEATVRRGRAGLRDILHGRDATRLAVIAGPCSIHDPEAALDYADRLSRLAEALKGELSIVMRTFFEKPRTRVGWKGFANDPDLDGSCDVERGLEGARALLLSLNAGGLPCGGEILEPFTPPYLADLLCWGGIGARTSESQPHRQLASGLPFPVGFKNGTCGNFDAACHAIHAAGRPHRFVGLSDDGSCGVVTTQGNADLHLVLRGGGGRTNFSRDAVAEAAARACEEGVARPVMVDCSHDNSGRDHRRQGAVCRQVLDQVRNGHREIAGLLLESNLEEGRQSDSGPLRYGVSITDACIGWNETADLLCETAEAVKLSR